MLIVDKWLFPGWYVSVVSVPTWEMFKVGTAFSFSLLYKIVCTLSLANSFLPLDSFAKTGTKTWMQKFLSWAPLWSSQCWAIWLSHGRCSRLELLFLFSLLYKIVCTLSLASSFLPLHSFAKTGIKTWMQKFSSWAPLWSSQCWPIWLSLWHINRWNFKYWNEIWFRRLILSFVCIFRWCWAIALTMCIICFHIIKLHGFGIFHWFYQTMHFHFICIFLMPLTCIHVVVWWEFTQMLISTFHL